MAYNTQCTCAAKQLYWSIHFLFTDASLTVDSVAKVMEMVPADRVVEVWERLGVLNSLVERISRKLLTPKEKTRACVDLYLNCSPCEPSWRDITESLYRFEELVAAREAKPFYHQIGKLLSLC